MRIEDIEVFLPELETFRKEMHQNPELSQQEFKTAERIKTFLHKNTSAKVQSIATTGILAIFEGKQKGKVVLLRADTDALPIVEINTFEHKSNVLGVSHKCGHDGHTSILVGLAQLLTKHPIQSGKVILLFQPAEENGMGADAVLKDKLFSDFSIDFVFALHNLPGFEKNKIVLKTGTFNANVKSILIKLEGKTAHAAEPEKGINPALAIADILQYAEKETLNQPQRDDFFLITPIYITMGHMAYGVSAGEGELHLTIRSWDVDLMEKKCKDLEAFITRTCATYKLKPQIAWDQIFMANKNNPEAMQVIKDAAKKAKLDTVVVDHPFKWGEDFGLFTQRYKGAMMGLGAGTNTPALHNPDYDFPDDITAAGIGQFYHILQEIL